MSVAGLARRSAYRVLTLAPARAVGRARTARAARILEGVQAVIGIPLSGHPVRVAHGPGAGLALVAERRSLVWMSGRVEREVQDAVVGRLAPGGTFVDVGASIGFFSLLAARQVGAGGRVVAFEPQPGAASSLRRNARLNGFDNVEVVEAAAGAQAGEVALYGVGTATARVARSGDGPSVSVRATTLDDHFATHRPAPDVVKIDVEGHEREVLAGMRRVLETSAPVVIVEIHGTADAVRAELERVGYTRSVLGSSHLLCTPA